MKCVGGKSISVLILRLLNRRRAMSHVNFSLSLNLFGQKSQANSIEFNSRSNARRMHAKICFLFAVPIIIVRTIYFTQIEKRKPEKPKKKMKNEQKKNKK